MLAESKDFIRYPRFKQEVFYRGLNEDFAAPRPAAEGGARGTAAAVWRRRRTAASSFGSTAPDRPSTSTSLTRLVSAVASKLSSTTVAPARCAAEGMAEAGETEAEVPMTSSRSQLRAACTAPRVPSQAGKAGWRQGSVRPPGQRSGVAALTTTRRALWWGSGAPPWPHPPRGAGCSPRTELPTASEARRSQCSEAAAACWPAAGGTLRRARRSGGRCSPSGCRGTQLRQCFRPLRVGRPRFG